MHLLEWAFTARGNKVPVGSDTNKREPEMCDSLRSPDVSGMWAVCECSCTFTPNLSMISCWNDGESHGNSTADWLCLASEPGSDTMYVRTYLSIHSPVCCQCWRDEVSVGLPRDLKHTILAPGGSLPAVRLTMHLVVWLNCICFIWMMYDVWCRDILWIVIFNSPLKLISIQ